MRKIICLFLALILCLGMTVPAFAAENGFVPSITYKPYPDIVPGVGGILGIIRDINGKIIDYLEQGCLEIIPLAHILEKFDIPEEIGELLRSVYEKLNDGSMKLPYEKFGANLNPANMVIRDLFDARIVCEEHSRLLAEEGVTLDLTFDLGVASDATVYAMTYDEQTDEWSPVVKTVNNGDGTVTCTFEHLCVVAFAMPLAGAAAPVAAAQTLNPMPWCLVLMLAIAGVTAILLTKKKKQEAA